MMRAQRIDVLLKTALFLAAAGVCGAAPAASDTCLYPESAAGGQRGGDTGTAAVAEGSGIGGTGIAPDSGTDVTTVAGKVIFSHGSAEAQSQGRSRPLAAGDPVCVGETIITAHAALVRIKMADEGLVEIRPQSQLTITKFVFLGSKGDNSLLALIKGACRVVTGAIGKQYPSHDLITTPTAIIGVRGTDHEAAVILPGDKGRFPAGTYDKVNNGETFIKTEKGELRIRPNQVGFAGNAQTLPVLLKSVPDFYLASPSAMHGEGAPAASDPEDGRKEDKPAEAAGEQGRSPASEHGPSAGEQQHGAEQLHLPNHPELPEAPPAILDLPEAPGHIDLPDASHRSELSPLPLPAEAVSQPVQLVSSKEVAVFKSKAKRRRAVKQQTD